MTPKQINWYWKLWGDACEANHWRMAKGKLLHNPERLGEIGRQVWAVAERLAAEQLKGINLDMLRHASHMVALGSDRSMKDLSNEQFNRVRVCFQLIADPDNLQAVMEWRDRSIAQRRGMVQFIRKKAPEAYIVEIAKRKHGTIYWEELEMPNLRVLARTLAQRKSEWSKPVEQDLVGVNQPF